MRLLLIAVSLLVASQAAAFAEGMSDSRRAELLNLLKHDCGSCHGLTMRGGLGPPLLPQTLQGMPVEYLSATILYGRPGTPMPPWQPFMTEAEATWLAQRIKEGIE